MPLIRYIDRNIKEEKLNLIYTANQIISEYQDAGYTLTLRQLYYQFVARGLIQNTQASYNKLGNAVSDGRMLGLIDWTAITDRLRKVQSRNHFDDPSQLVDNMAGWYSTDLWADQEYRPEVWVEKDALADIVANVCEPLDVPYLVCRGYTSQTAMWEAGYYRTQDTLDANQIPVIIHLGDHDPSGLDMSRDIGERISLFTGEFVEIDRIALNMDQVDQYNPPPNPAKLTDSRVGSYISDYGANSWELDALDPSVLSDIIMSAIARYMDLDLFKQAKDREIEQRKQLKMVSNRWPEITAWLEQNK